MKVPDKIYCGNNGHGNLSYSREKVYPSMEEYIRKDALLEWAKKRKEQAGIGLSEYDMGHENGICEVIEELIKHIESL